MITKSGWVFARILLEYAQKLKSKVITVIFTHFSYPSVFSVGSGEYYSKSVRLIIFLILTALGVALG
jgi:hypothetical protein